jgi:hypothetical protein
MVKAMTIISFPSFQLHIICREFDIIVDWAKERQIQGWLDDEEAKQVTHGVNRMWAFSCASLKFLKRVQLWNKNYRGRYQWVTGVE